MRNHVEQYQYEEIASDGDLHNKPECISLISKTNESVCVMEVYQPEHSNPPIQKNSSKAGYPGNDSKSKIRGYTLCINESATNSPRESEWEGDA